MQSDPLQRFQRYLGKVLKIVYREEGDDDEGYGWSNGHDRSVVLDGIVREASRFFLVGHDGEMDFLISPRIDKPLSLQLSNWPDLSYITAIYCDGRLIDVVLPTSSSYEKQARWDLDICADSRPRQPESGNYFLHPDYLAQNGLKTIVPTQELPK